MSKNGRWVLLLASLFIFSGASNAWAIAAWAKKYNVDCSTCHSVGQSTLNTLGQEFLRRGHRMPDDNEMAKNWNEIFSINTKLRYHDSNSAGHNSTFEVHAFSIYTGGVLSKHFSYFTEMYLYENRGRTTGANNEDFGRSKLADAYLMFTSHPDSNTYTSFRFGQISSSQLQLFWGVGPRYTETRNYLVNNSTVTPNSYRPFMRNFGVEISQTVNNLHAAFAVLNGTGSSPTNSIDNNESKDVYGTVDYLLGNQGSAVGVYGYRGKGLVLSSSGSSWENSFSRIGAFGRWINGPLSVTSAVTKGTEQLNTNHTRANNLGLLLETDYELNDKVALFGRYDYFDQNQSKPNNQLNGPMFGAIYRLFDNGRMTFEYHKQGKWVPVDQSKPWECRLEIGFMF